MSCHRFSWVRFILVTFAVCSGACEADSPDDSTWASQLRGKLARRGDLRDGPVVEADLSQTQVTNDDSKELRSFTSLEHLNLRGNSDEHNRALAPFDDAGLEQVAALANLRSLDIGYTSVQGPGLVHLQKLPMLQALNLEGLNIQNEDLTFLRDYPVLEELSLSVWPDFQTMKDLPHLRTLRITPAHDQAQISEEQLKSQLLLLREFKALQTLDIPVTDAVLLALRQADALHKHSRAVSKNGTRPKRLEDVETFDLRDASRADLPFAPSLTFVTNHGMSALFDCRELRTLDLSATLLTDAGLSELKRFPELHTLALRSISYLADNELRYFPDVTDVGLKALTEIPTLRSLDLTGCQHTDQSLAEIQKLNQLHTLLLGSGLNWRDTGITDAMLNRLVAMTELRTLSLAGQKNISVEGYQTLRRLQKLQELDLSSTALTDAHLDHLKDLPELRRLHLGDVKLTDLGLQQIGQMRSLQILDIRNCECTGSSLKHLAGLRDLRRLILSDRDLNDQVLRSLREIGLLDKLDTTWQSREPNLGDVRHGLYEPAAVRTLNLLNVTDAGLAELKGLSELEVLQLHDSKVVGPGLRELAGLTRLHSLDIEVTDSVLAALREVDRIYTLTSAINRDGGRPKSASEVTRFEGLPKSRSINNKLTEAGLLDLKALVNLRTIRVIDQEQLTDQHLVALEQIGLLHALPQAVAKNGVRPTGPKDVESLSLAYSKLTDAGLRPLATLVNLKNLNLRGTAVSKVEPLTSLGHVETLDLSETDVSDVMPLATLKDLKTLSLRRSKVMRSGLVSRHPLNKVRPSLSIEF